MWNRVQSAAVPAGTIPLLVPPAGVCLSKAYAHNILLLVPLSSLLTVCWAVLTEECRIAMSSGIEQSSLKSAGSPYPVGQSSAHWGVQDHCAGSASCQLLHSRVRLWRRWSDDGLGRRQCRSPDRPCYLRGCCQWLAIPGWGTTLHHLCLTMDQGLCCSWPVPVLAMPGSCRVNCAAETSTPCTVTNFTRLGWVETVTTATTASTADCVKLYSGMAEHLTGVTEALCLIREVQMWSCDGCMWWPHTTELAHSHNHTNRNVEAAMSDSDKTFDLFLYLNSWMTFLLLKFDQTQWGKLLEWKL